MLGERAMKYKWLSTSLIRLAPRKGPNMPYERFHFPPKLHRGHCYFAASVSQKHPVASGQIADG
jgi:hypothetical protein